MAFFTLTPSLGDFTHQADFSEPAFSLLADSTSLTKRILEALCGNLGASLHPYCLPRILKAVDLDHFPTGFCSIPRTRGPHCRSVPLGWSTLDLREGVASVEQPLQRTGRRGYQIKCPKTVHSRRSIALSPEIVEVLRALRERQTEERRRRSPCPSGVECKDQVCPHWHETGLVFTPPNGKPLHANNVRQRDLRKLCTRLGLPDERALHNLRHAHGSYLLQRGVSIKVVQERLGHSSAQFTLNTYAHVLAGMQESAVKVISAMLQGPTGGK